MAKNKKPNKLKARLPRGFVDRTADDIRASDDMLAKIKAVYEHHGFDPIETPTFEYTDCLGKFLPDTDRPNAGVFSVQDDDEQWMSLRYDLTAPMARHVAENFNEIQLPFRTYRVGYVYRNEKPGPGRFRQFMQFDADTVGAPGVQTDAEACMMMADTMEALGIERGNYVIRVNNRKVLDGVMEEIGLGGDEHAEPALRCSARSTSSTSLAPMVCVCCWAKGARTRAVTSPRVLASALNNVEKVIAFTEGAPSIWSNDGTRELDTMQAIFDACGYGEDRIKIDPSVVRGLEYYTGPVYEAELLFDVTNEKGEVVQFGSVGGGGRYDGLVKRFVGRDVPATGFSIGVSRLMTALKNLGKLGTDRVVEPVLVTVMDGDVESLGHYMKMVQELRSAGVRAELYQGNWKKFGNQLKYADKRGCPLAIIQGSDEKEKGIVQIKDLEEGKRLSAEIEDNATWRESRPAQVEVPLAEMVETVKKMLADQAADRAAETK